MTVFKIGDIIEYRSLMGETELGTVVEVDGLRCRVDYSPWGDSFWATADHLKLVRRT